jgi:hypothetical protein
MSAPGSDDDDLRDLRARLARLECRVARIESHVFRGLLRRLVEWLTGRGS